MLSSLVAGLLLTLTTPLMGQYGYGYGKSSESAGPASGYQEMPYQSTSPASSVPGNEAAPESGTYQTSYPYNLQLLATRHFDYIVSPQVKPARGSMEDTSISLGTYARQLRAEKQLGARPGSSPTPGAMAQPSAPR